MTAAVPIAAIIGDVLKAIVVCCEEALAGEATDWNEGLRSVKALAERHTLQGQQPKEDAMHPDHDPDRLPESPPLFEGPSAPARPGAPARPSSGPSSPEDADRSEGGRPDPTP